MEKQETADADLLKQTFVNWSDKGSQSETSPIYMDTRALCVLFSIAINRFSFL